MSGMSAELKWYVDDRTLLKQYADSDRVMNNGKMYEVQVEEVPQLSDSLEKVVRPVIRLQEKNIILTRINPEIRDTSVLVRLRPAWDHLRSYLTAKGRKRFEVYVCTMAERDYALEMWRLLDPEAHLINREQVFNRVVCVKSGKLSANVQIKMLVGDGSRKSLLNVFRDGNCHPKMAMVIDDHSKVWEDRDQPRVHVVPPFAPYYAPQAETANAIPVLCVARNVACNVRGYFFKEFDENLLSKTFEVFYEYEVVTLPHSPDVSNYLMSEDFGFAPNGPENTPLADGMHGAEIDKRLNFPGKKHAVDVANSIPVKETSDVKSGTSQPTITIIPYAVGPNASRTLMPSQKPGLLDNTARQDFSFSDQEHDMKRRILTMKHGPDSKNQGSGEPPLLSKPPVQLSTANIQPLGECPTEEDSNEGHINSGSSGFSQEADSKKFDEQRAHQNQLGQKLSSFSTSCFLSNSSQVKAEEVGSGHDKKEATFSSGSRQSGTKQRSDIQIILTPNSILLKWWKRLDQSGRNYTDSKIGKLGSLLQVVTHINLVQALAHFWNPVTSTFTFGKHELVPTIEEYNVAIGVTPITKLFRPPIGLEPAVVLAEFLERKINEIEKVLEAHNNSCPLSFLVKHYAYPTKQSMCHSSRVFLLAFFGFVVFPHTRDAMNPLVAHLVRQVCCGMNFSNMILAETFLSLTRFKKNKEGSLHVPAALLEIWFLSHIKKFCINMGLHEIGDHTSPIEMFLQNTKVFSRRTLSKWINFLKNITPRQFLWHVRWPRLHIARLTHQSGNPIPLVGFTGCTSYYPLRVIRQYGAIQEIPPPLRSDLFQLDITQKDLSESQSHVYQKKVDYIECAWHDCHPQKITYAGELEGQMKEHHASLEYINRLVDSEFLPFVPEKPMKLTHNALQAQIEQLKRDRDEAQAKVSYLALQNKRLRHICE
ncbi:uncharacterized protein LOC115693551 [Syzygium oleosum]|uniref:uncharacterized protein LOC115693551 n=1 Tax=Syzygium oleosum TaxID=219896 RepID=UPI0024BA72BF|nr:uncharacterized protein LOC115693551 [Syzygium oleosum]